MEQLQNRVSQLEMYCRELKADTEVCRKQKEQEISELKEKISGQSHAKADE